MNDIMRDLAIDRTPQVSVVIPAYNCAAYVGQAIDSVLSQTYTDWEIIVVDDGSKDDTRLVLEKYGDRRIRYVYQKNQGVSLARNHGITTSIKIKAGLCLASRPTPCIGS